MRIRIIGAGWFGCSTAVELIARGHDVEVWETASHIFAGASGSNPARLHMGQHYPRSRLTRAACQDHHSEFMTRYGFLTRVIPINIYAVAAHDSLVDFGTYLQVLRGEVEFVTIYDPREFHLRNVEGAILTGERHIVIREAREFFEDELEGNLCLDAESGTVDNPDFEWNIDCTFCSLDSENIERYEPCVTGILEGPTNRSVTIMDGPFPSLYVWDERHNLSSLTSASLTPFAKNCSTWVAARSILDALSVDDVRFRCDQMLAQMATYWDGVRDLYKVVDHKLSIRAMPRSAADARLPDVIKVGDRALRVRAGKIDAIFMVARDIIERIGA